MQSELEVVRETFKHSSLSLDTQNLELERKLNEEKKRRQVSVGLESTSPFPRYIYMVELLIFQASEESLVQEKEARCAAETELSRLKALNSERETCLTEYRSQIAAMVALNKGFSEKLRVCA